MFEDIFFPHTAIGYRAAPLAEQRARYLAHLRDSGATRFTLRKLANDQLSLVRLLNLNEDSRVHPSQVEAAAEIWSQPKGRRWKRPASPKARVQFIGRGIRWLRFMGWLEEPERKHHSHHLQVAIFEGWLREERNLATATIRGYCQAADHFFFWLDERCTPLSLIQVADIDDAMPAEYRRGAWSRRTIRDFAQRLRAFFLYAESRNSCRAGLAAGIMAPRFMADEAVPKGIKRDDVLRLLASVQRGRPVDKRDHAILMLLIAYGLRSGEVVGLRLDDLDCENDLIRVRCPKPGRIHLLPLSSDVGNAILSYIREARPTSYGRSLFFTSRVPIQSVTRKTICKIVHDRLAAIGVVTGRRGPHALRHAAAQHLLDQGISMKVIGDFLGHRDPSSTLIYAKVNLPALREVAALDLEGLA